MKIADNKKHVLVVGGFRDCHDTLLTKGYELTWLVNKETFLPEDTKRGYASIILYDKSYSLDKIMALVQGLHSYFPFEIIGAFHDEYQGIAYDIAIKLGLKPFCDFSKFTLKTTINKDLMREHMKSLDVSQIKYAKISSIQEAKDFISMLNDKVIIKPLDGAGSRGIYFIEKDVSLDYLKQLDLCFPVLIEQYIGGLEYSCEAISLRDEHRVVAITKKYIHNESFIETGHLIPAPKEEVDYKKVNEYMIKFLNHMSIKNGLTHTEIKIYNDNIYVIETHTRFGGDKIPLLIENSFGINLYEICTAFATSASINQNETKQLEFADILKNYNDRGISSAICFYYPKQVGLITSITGEQEISSLDGFVKLNISKKIGDFLKEPKHSFDRPASVIFEGKTHHEALQRAQDAINLLNFNVIPVSLHE